jgi:CheY-like chemotaxis protein
MKILLVDDDIMSLKVTIQILERNGYLVWFALNGSDALELLEEEKFDLVILDLFMPEMGGMDLLDVLRRTKQFRIPIIVLSRSHASEIVQTALDKGANDFISKPFDPEKFLGTVKKYLP